MGFILITILLSLNANFTFASDDQSYLHYIVAEDRMLGGDPLGALDEYKKASEHDQGSAEIKAKIASAYLEIGEQEKAEKEIKEALELQKDSVATLNVYLEILLTQKEYARALKVCEDILKQEPDNKEVINYKVALMIEVGKKKEALNFLKKYSIENPSNEFPYYYLGLLSEDAGNFGDAEKYLTKALTLNPEYEPSLITLMLLYEKKFYGDQLLKKLEQLSQKTDDSNDDLNNRIIVLNMKLGGKEHLNKAIDYLTRVYGKQPLPYISIQKSSLYDRLGDKAAATKELEESIQNNPKNEALMFTLALLYDAYGAKEEALRTMEAVLELNPNNPEILNYIGYSYADKGVNFKKARELLTKALKLSPNDPYIVDSIAWLDYKEGNLATAKKDVEKVVELLKQKDIFEEEIIRHTITIYKSTDSTAGRNKIKEYLTDMLNSKEHNDKKDLIKKFLESVDEGPQRSPASIKK